MPLTDILRTLKKELKLKSNLREKMLRNARQITQQSKEAILLIHRNKLTKAQKRIETAGKILQSTYAMLAPSPELKNSGALFDAAQEYAEAAILMKLEMTGNYPRPEEINVPSDAYVLGLADVVGELRRKAVESIKNGDVDSAEWCLQHMESIYGELMILNEQVFSVLPGLRRKCDVARHLLELTGSDVVLEKRRKRLEEYVQILERTKPRKKK